VQEIVKSLESKRQSFTKRQYTEGKASAEQNNVSETNVTPQGNYTKLCFSRKTAELRSKVQKVSEAWHVKAFMSTTTYSEFSLMCPLATWERTFAKEEEDEETSPENSTRHNVVPRQDTEMHGSEKVSEKPVELYSNIELHVQTIGFKTADSLTIFDVSLNTMLVFMAIRDNNSDAAAGRHHLVELVQSLRLRHHTEWIV
jgi:hypothetical protein